MLRSGSREQVRGEPVPAESITLTCCNADVIRNGALTRGFSFSGPSLKTFVGLPVFLLASGVQHDCHLYLASLKKYSLPSHAAFRSIVAPHYLAECLIYVSLVVVAAPQGLVLNRTLLAALCFVAVNLGITSSHSRRWYASNFGEDKVAGKWNMVPFLY